MRTFVLFTLLCGLSLLWTASAFAQTVAIAEGAIKRSSKLRPQAQNPMWISKADCLEDDQFEFPLTVSNFSSYQLEVWAGSASDDCRTPEARRGTTAVCWQVWKGVPTSTGLTVPVRSQDIVSRRKASAGVETGPGTGTIADCEWTEATSSPVGVSLYFMFIDAGSGQRQGGTVWQTKFDLAGPSAPRDVTAGVGNTLIVVNWSESTDTDKAGYRFFCDPVPGSGSSAAIMRPFDIDASVDADLDVDSDTDAADDLDAESDAPSDASDREDVFGGGGASGAGGGTLGVGGDTGDISDGACSSQVLRPGQEPDLAYECGSGVGTSGTISGLVNGVKYTVAVAAFDSVGNVGKLSNLACASPNEVDDFFTVYRDAGGRAGGGYCAMTQWGTDVGTGAGVAVLAVASMAAIGSLVRRRRSR